jgi:GNAT superfamily N-acetyltransferase
MARKQAPFPMEWARPRVRDARTHPSQADEDIRQAEFIQRTARRAAYVNPELGITPEELFARDIGSDGTRLRERLAWWERQIKNPSSDHQVFLAGRGELYMGVSHVSVHEDESRWLDYLYVLPSFQRKGVGKLLLRQALAWHGPQQDVYLDVVSYNEGAKALYQKYGFVVIREVMEQPEIMPPEATVWIPEIEMVRRSLTLPE